MIKNSDTAFRIEYVENAERSVWGPIVEGLKSFNRDSAGADNMQELVMAVYSRENELVGGVIADTYWEWLFINVMWVKPELRGLGLGRKLLLAAEQKARERNVKHAYLDTFSFQAPEFYQKLGYSVFGELKDFPPGHARYFMVKHFEENT
jgi:GNAT superfamily N-acetyltransferase